MIFAIFAGIILIIIIYYLNQNNDQPIPNHGTIFDINEKNNPQQKISTFMEKNKNKDKDNIIDELVSQYNIDDNSYSPSDPMANDYGYVKNHHKNADLSDNDKEDQEFFYKKKKFIKKTPDDIKDLFDVQKMLPQEIEDDWFDIEPLQCTKKIKGTHLIHPKVPSIEFNTRPLSGMPQGNTTSKAERRSVATINKCLPRS